MKHCIIIRSPVAGIKTAPLLALLADFPGIQCTDELSEHTASAMTMIAAHDIPDNGSSILAHEIVRYRDEPIALLVGENESEISHAAQFISEWIGQLAHSLPTIMPEPSADTGEKEHDGKSQDQVQNQNLENAAYIEINPASTPPAAFPTVFAEYRKPSLSIHCTSLWPAQLRTLVSKITRIPESYCHIIPDAPLDFQLTPLYTALPQLSICAAIAAVFLRCRVQIHIADITEWNKIISSTSMSARLYLPPPKSPPSRLRIAITVPDSICFNEERHASIIRALHGCYAADQNNQAAITVRASAEASVPASFDASFDATLGGITREIMANYWAASADMSPLQWRLTNIHTAHEEHTASNSRIQILKRVAALSDFERKYAAYKMPSPPPTESLIETYTRRGIGLALSEQHTPHTAIALPPPAISLRLISKRQLHILTHAISPPDGAAREWRRAAAKILELSVSDVKIIPATTTQLKPKGPTLPGNNITTMLKIVTNCAHTLKKRKKLSMKFPIETTKTRTSFPALHSNCAVAIELEADINITTLRVRNIWVVIEAGKIYHEARAHSIIKKEIENAFSRFTALPSSDMDFDTHIEFIDQSKSSLPKPIEILPHAAIAAAYAAAADNLRIESIPTGKDYLDNIIILKNLNKK